jgi:hypothetical protein
MSESDMKLLTAEFDLRQIQIGALQEENKIINSGKIDLFKVLILLAHRQTSSRLTNVD